MLTSAAVLAVSGLATAAGPLNFVDATGDRLSATRTEGTCERMIDVGDFDKDGDLDVVVANALGAFGQRSNEIYINNNGSLDEITYGAGSIIPEFSVTSTSRTAFFRDLDGDGWLDIHVTNDSNSGGDNGRDKVLIAIVENGQFVRFENQTAARLPNNGLLGASCGADIVDYDNDGDLDLWQGNYPFDIQDRLLLNDGNGFFTDVTPGRVQIDGGYVVDVSNADFNNDGKQDVLITNMSNSDGTYIMYNDNMGLAGQLADFDYPGATTFFGVSSFMHACEPADFNNDGLVDFYWGSRDNQGDVIMRNTGLDADNKAVFVQDDWQRPHSVIGQAGRTQKIEVADLDFDGDQDLVLLKDAGSNPRPTILRNTSHNGDISFVDWTPGFMTSAYVGWHAFPVNLDDDAAYEIVVGGENQLFYLDDAPSKPYDADASNGTELPGFWNNDPVVIDTSSASSGQVYEYDLAVGAGSNNHVAAIVNGEGDYLLELFRGSTLLASSDRGGLGVEEAIQAEDVGQNTMLTLRLTVVAAVRGGSNCPADQNGDGNLTGADFNAFIANFVDGNLAADLNGDGNLTGADFNGFIAAFVDGCSGFTLEALGRTN